MNALETVNQIGPNKMFVPVSHYFSSVIFQVRKKKLFFPSPCQFMRPDNLFTGTPCRTDTDKNGNVLLK